MDTLKWLAKEYMDGAITELEFRNQVVSAIVDLVDADILQLAEVLSEME